MAPELLRGVAHSSKETDVYSFGIVLYEVYSRKEPYNNEDVKLVLKDIKDPKIQKRPPFPPGCSPDICGLMRDCWQEYPFQRPAADEIDNRLKRLTVEMAEPLQLTNMKNAVRNEELLSKVFPKHIAEALREGRKVEPEHHELVTIFFSDIVSFTDISSKLSLDKVSSMLDRLYEKLDELSYKHDIFKIETIVSDSTLRG